jgi:molybdopterin-containing oxidoreductase family iron-sulfur binding subunit
MTETVKEGRRRFLKLAGLGALAFSARKVLGKVAGEGARRWAMVVDPSRCRWDDGCNGCIKACHAAHNVPSVPDPKHEVKWIWKEKFADVFADQEAPHVAESLTSRPILALCNHCDDPPCARVCPTKATWRRDDGIVAIDPHRCIGCRYCVAACPYGSRSFNWVDPKPYLARVNPDYPARTKGIVEKCTFCVERVDRGRLPACVEGCPEKALIFGDLNDPQSDVRRTLRSRYALRRRPSLGTHPEVYYLV